MAVAYKLLDLEDALERGVTLSIKGAPSREAAAEVYRLGLHPDAIATFAIRGIASYINDRLSVIGDQWGEDDSPDVSVGTSAPRPAGRSAAKPRHYARDMWERVLSAKTWETADGRRKALIAFTAQDAAHILSDARAKAAGHLRVATAMELALSLLQKHKAETVADLPVKAKAAIAEAVA